MENINETDNSIQNRIFITNELIESRDIYDLKELKAKSLNIKECELGRIKELSEFTLIDNPIDAEPYPIDEMIKHLEDLKEKGATHIGIEYNYIWNRDGEEVTDVYTLSGHKFRKSTSNEIIEYLNDRSKQRKGYLKMMVKKLENDLKNSKEELKELDELEQNARK